jgi:hypothetical protein
MQGRIQRRTNHCMAAERTTCCAPADKMTAEVQWKIVSQIAVAALAIRRSCVQDKMLGSQKRSKGVDTVFLRLAGGGGAWPRKALEVLPRRASLIHDEHNTKHLDFVTPCSGYCTASASLFDPSGPSTGYPWRYGNDTSGSPPPVCNG